MQLNPYLTFNGQCKEAFQFYEKTLGGKIEAMMTHEGTPMGDQVKKEWRDKILHASLKIGYRILMGSDAPPDDYEAPKGITISISIDKVAEAERIFQALSENGSVRMPLQQTFWAARFGMLVDRFGIPWMINCEASK
jgi:PhnB protein